MIELEQNKIWSDSLNSTFEFGQPWDCVDKGLHKFICFGEGGDSGGAGAGAGGGSGGVEAYGPEAEEVSAELGEMGFGLGTAYGPAVDDPIDVFDVYAPPPPNVLITAPFDPPQVLYAKAARTVVPAVLNTVAPEEVTVPAPQAELDIAPAPTQPALGFADSVLDPDMMNPNLVSLPEALPPDLAEMTGFSSQSRAEIAATPGLESEVYPGFSLFGFNTGIGRGMFGGYTSTDAPTAQADVDQGYATSEVGSFDPLGFLGGLGKVAANVALPGSAFALNAIQQASKPPGMSDINALSNVFSSDRGLTEAEVLGAPTAAPPAVPAAVPAAATPAAVPAPASNPFDTGFSNFGVRDPLVELIEKQREEESTVKMAQGGGIKDALSFLSPAYGLGRAAKKGGIEGALSFLSPVFAVSQGKLPGPFNNLMNLIGSQSDKTEQQAPAVRATEAPTEQIALPPTQEELEEARDVAVLQQVLSGAPVEAQAGGLISAYQMGGAPSPYFEGMVKGRGDGMSDSIPFTIEGTQPAILSRDEYVLPADIVSMMGNGSSDAGAEKIDTFINDFRVQKYGRGKQPPETRRGLSGVA